MSFNLGYLSLVIAIPFTLMFLYTIVREMYLFITGKENRKFWSGIGILIFLYYSGFMALIGWDSFDKKLAQNEIDNPVLEGSMSAYGIQSKFPEIEDHCVMDKTELSKQCSFVMLLKQSETIHADFITSETESLFRFGRWPNEREQKFPPIIFP